MYCLDWSLTAAFRNAAEAIANSLSVSFKVFSVNVNEDSSQENTFAIPELRGPEF